MALCMLLNESVIQLMYIMIYMFILDVCTFLGSISVCLETNGNVFVTMLEGSQRNAGIVLNKYP